MCTSGKWGGLMKEIDVLGMHITDYSAVDAVKESLRYLGNGAMNSIFFVSSHILMEAGEREELKALLDKMDMLLCGEPAVLEVLGVNAPKRREEIEDEVFLRDFIKRLGRAKQKVFFVADSEEKAESLVNYATQVHENIIVAGSFVVTEDTTEEALINEINDVSPRTIISALPFEMQLHLMGEKGHLVNADVWIGLLEDAKLGNEIKKTPVHFLDAILCKQLFVRKVKKYQSDGGESANKEKKG